MAVAAEPAELDLFPGLAEVRELAREHTLVPLRHTFVADTETPVSAYLRLRGGGPSFLLESAEQGQRFGRWSFLGFRPRAVIRWRQGDAGDPYALVEAELGRYRIAPLEGLPPFAGGAVGLFGYDLVRSAEPTVGEGNPDELGVPELALMVSDVLVAFDHLKHEVTVLANVFAEEDVERGYEAAAAAIADVRERLAAPVPRGRAGRREPPEFSSNIGSDGYAAAVERSKEYIRAGDVYQVVPSQRWSADAPVDGFSLYRGLRTVNPSPYMYFLDFEDFEIAGASPESLVKVTGRRAEQRPIAGTRPRAATTEEDLERAKGLLADEKERAVRRGGRLPLLHGRPRHLHLHPLGARQGRARARPGGRGDRRRLRPGLRGSRDRGQGRRGVRGAAAGLLAGGLGVAMARTLVIDNYDSFTYNLVQYLGELGAEPEVVRNDETGADDLLERGYQRVVG